MNIFDGAESLLPQLQLDRDIELGEAGIEVMLEGIRIRKVNGMGLGGIFGDIGEVETKGFTLATELDFSLMLQAELKSSLSDLLNRVKMRRVDRKV
jgi:hypothetical protein